MRIETKIILFIFTIIILLCLINSYRKENFDPTTPGPTTAPTTAPTSINLSSLSSLDVTLNNLSSFANGIDLIDPNKITAAQLTELKENLLKEVSKLSSSLTSIDEQMKLKQSQDALSKTNTNTPEEAINLKTTQLLQDKEIEKLTTRLNTLKQLYQDYSQEKLVEEQPKIPIYSSCIVAEASGGYSLDNLNKNQTNTNPNKPIVYANQPVVPGTQTYNPNKNIDFNTASLTFEDILEKLSQNEINVNFNV